MNVNQVNEKIFIYYDSIRPQTLVIAGLGDMTRPAEKLSLRQSGALACTGELSEKAVGAPVNHQRVSVRRRGQMVHCR